MKTSTLSKEISGLNWLRGLAALLVLLSHARSFFYVDFKDYSNEPNIFVKIFYLITGLGHPAVIIFFVLSGFLVAGSIDRQWRQNKWNIKNYFTARIIRLWVVLVPCLVFTFFLDKIGYFFNPNFYDGNLKNIISSAPANTVDWSIQSFISNIFFLQTITSPVYGSNGPFWSLANEFWYYLLFPLFYYFFYKKLAIKIFILTIFLLLSFFLGGKIIFLFPIWIMGYFSYLITIKENKFRLKENKILAALILICFTNILFSYKFININELIHDYIMGIITMLTVVVLNHRMFQIGEKISHFLSKISYSLYLIHFPLLALISAYYDNFRASTFTQGVLVFISSILLSIFLAYIIWYMFERHTDQIKNKIINIKSK